MDILNYLPEELVNEIADYHDYEKYCKPSHVEILQSVLNDIIDMDSIMTTIAPNIALQCWGAGSKYLHEWNDLEYQNWDNEITIENSDYIEDVYRVLDLLVE